MPPFTATLSTYYYNVDAVDQHYSFEGWVWTNGLDSSPSSWPGTTRQALIWIFSDIGEPLSPAENTSSTGQPPALDTMGWTTSRVYDQTLGSLQTETAAGLGPVVNFYTYDISGVQAQAGEIFLGYTNLTGLTAPPKNTNGMKPYAATTKNDTKVDPNTLVVLPANVPAQVAQSASLSSMGPLNCPVSGVSLSAAPPAQFNVNGNAFPHGEFKYVTIRFGNPHVNTTETVVTFFDEDPNSPNGTFRQFPCLWMFSNAPVDGSHSNPPGSHFNTTSLQLVTEADGSEWVYIWGVGVPPSQPGKKRGLFLAKTPVSEFPALAVPLQYFVLVDGAGSWVPGDVVTPKGSTIPVAKEPNPVKAPLFDLLQNQLDVGDFSVGYIGEIQLWIVLVATNDVVQVFHSTAPTGPWTSDPQFPMFDALWGTWTGNGTSGGFQMREASYIRDASYDGLPPPYSDGLNGPVAPLSSPTSLNPPGKAYLPQLIPALTQVQLVDESRQLSQITKTSLVTLFWSVSTGKPYYAPLMYSTFTFTESYFI